MTKRPHHDPMEEVNHRWASRALATGKVAANALQLASRQMLGRRDESVAQSVGERLARELDGMKGLPMKVGQILSYFDGILDEGVHAALRPLQRGARPISFDALAPELERALGGRVTELFDSIEQDALAAASIGQVHRAIYRGERVAVKIQYPQVRSMFEADLGRLTTLSRIASFATMVDGPAMVDELRTCFLEECDYEREADHQEAFARAFAAESQITIPRVIRERCAQTVLTTRFEEGDDLYSFGSTADRSQKSVAGLILARFAHRSFFALAAIHADPHPGNYLFTDSGRVVFLDFGCVRRFEESYVEAERTLVRIVIGNERSKFRDAVMATGMVPRPKRFDFDLHWEWLRHQLAPYCSARFHFTFEHLRKGMEYSKPDNPNLRLLAIPPPWIWQQRLQIGLHAVLARLDAEGPFRDVLQAALDEPRGRL